MLYATKMRGFLQRLNFRQKKEIVMTIYPARGRPKIVPLSKLSFFLDNYSNKLTKRN